MITPDTYGNSLMYLNNSSNDSSAFISGRYALLGSNIANRRANSVYSNFDRAANLRTTTRASIIVARFGLSRVAFPANSDWSWRAVPT